MTIQMIKLCICKQTPVKSVIHYMVQGTLKPLLSHKIWDVGEASSVSEITNSKLKRSEIRDGKAQNLQGIQQV
jgi:hypothetical protein